MNLGSGKTNGSELSLSGLVQLPPYESMLPREETEESEMPEQAEDGRLMLSAWLSISASRWNCPVPLHSIPIWATGVLGGENRRNALGVGARYPSSGSEGGSENGAYGSSKHGSGVSIVGIGKSRDAFAKLEGA